MYSFQYLMHINSIFLVIKPIELSKLELEEILVYSVYRSLSSSDSNISLSFECFTAMSRRHYFPLKLEWSTPGLHLKSHTQHKPVPQRPSTPPLMWSVTEKEHLAEFSRLIYSSL